MANRIFSGIRPSGKLHLGNYLGAIKNWLALSNSTMLTTGKVEGIELQDRPNTDPRSAEGFGEARQAIFAVVDYHGITTPFDPEKYSQQIRDTVLDFLAAGIDPKKSLLMRQSHVPQHTELAWIFNAITPVSWLDRLPTYREQLEKSPKYNNMGLLDYPVLMAADILIYKSNLVPVGEDQLPHIDLANEIAKKFNSMFGETFTSVKPHMAEGARIMSLQDPTKKMSKTPSTGSTPSIDSGQASTSAVSSVPNGSLRAGSGQAGDDYIALSDTPDVIREKIKKAVTDSGKEVIFDMDKKPAISNLITIYHLLSQNSIKEIENKYGGKSYVEFKNDLAEVIVDFLKPFQEKRKELENNLTYVEDVLIKSEEKARIIASGTLSEVKQKMGLI